MTDVTNIEAIGHALRQGERSLTVTGLRGSSSAMVLARLAAETRRTLFCVVANDQSGASLEQDLALFTDTAVQLYPAYDIPPYTPLSPDRNTIANRLAALYALFTAETPRIFITSAEALLYRVMPRQTLAHLAELLIRGEEIEPANLTGRLVRLGYEPAAMVQSVGDFSVRGGIVDIFSPGFEAPLRLDFFGDTVESLRLFDPISQRSIQELDEAILLPAHECLYSATDSPMAAELLDRFDRCGAELGWKHENTGRLEEQLRGRHHFPGIEFFLPLFHRSLASTLDYAPKDAVAVLINPPEIEHAMDLTWERIRANCREATQGDTPVLPPDQLFWDSTTALAGLKRMAQVRLHDFITEDMDRSKVYPIKSDSHRLFKQELELQRHSEGLLPPLARTLTGWLAQGERVGIACRSPRHARHLAELLTPHHLAVVIEEPPADLPALPADQIVLYPTPLTAGFDLPELGLHLLSESELFGEMRLGPRRRQRRKEKGEPVRFEELRVGDIVVHEEHGLGTYQGLNSLEVNGVRREFLIITYLGDEKLYVPVDRLVTVTKYKGLTDKQPKLDHLGGKAWATVKRKVKEAVWKVAQDLLKLYAKRQLVEGRAFSMTDQLFEELEESFPFDETPGQLKAINDVIADLTSTTCMDRLVCGDVGYGKTEVAIRAAFKVVEDKYQVAVLVPTTVLAEQHAETFRERLTGFPVTIRCLNRFRSNPEQRETIKGLAEGRVDIVIGTHRLLSKDVQFKRLGLLIVDEEHRFGVAHKEKLKRLRVGVDVLTLTATPIPRTLQMSLLGVRDLSIINTAPEHRRSVKTFVAKYDDLVIKEAVTREMQRQGQVFLVSNRVRSIYEMARRVQAMVPLARVAVAHGQMAGKDLEEIMVAFVHREIDVLVCTTIIESGLDIPNANTIIITRADRLGLAEIYQLRGRVGRSREQAFAYLLVPALDSLSKDAQQRLQALMDYNELGGGFKLAMSDLQIRGGGNILGESQSGTIASVGYDLYLDLLQKTVEDLKRGQQEGAELEEPVEMEPEINLQLAAFLPATYIADANQRYIAYRRLSFMADAAELADLTDELVDRYGPLPEEAKNLLDVVSLKQDLKQARISRLEQGVGTLAFSFHDKRPVRPEQVLRMVQGSRGAIRLLPDSRLLVKLTENVGAEAIAVARKTLRALLDDAM
ncbi:MAG: transcription-repair coupling factor [Desulfobacterales bacterium CG2_30_60_27]|nr:MAG: transcription-repair coupling factor [Desulfobacterales bacterium CG2_30_60_27]